MTLEEYTKRIHPDQREEFILKSKSMNEGRSRHFELNKRWNSGTEQKPRYLHFQGHAILELDVHGRPAYVINAVNDVTQDMRIYQAARDISRKYDAILSDPFVAMSFYDNKGSLINHNEAMNNLLHGIDSSLFKEIFKPQEHKDLSVTRHLYYPEYGIDKYVECHIQPLYNAKGEIANYLMTTQVGKSSRRKHVHHLLLQAFDIKAAVVGATTLVDSHQQAQTTGGDILQTAAVDHNLTVKEVVERFYILLRLCRHRSVEVTVENQGYLRFAFFSNRCFHNYVVSMI